MAAIEDSDALLIFRVGPVLCCAPTLPVSSIIQPPHLTLLPGTTTANPGIFKHGTHIVSSRDLRYCFGVEAEDYVQPGRMIITQLSIGGIAFWVDEILDVISMPSTGWGALPALIPRGVFSRTLLYKEVIHLYAEFEALNSLQSAGYLKPYIVQLIEQHKTDNGSGKTSSVTSAKEVTQHSEEYKHTEKMNVQQQDIPVKNVAEAQPLKPQINLSSATKTTTVPPSTSNALKKEKPTVQSTVSTNTKASARGLSSSGEEILKERIKAKPKQVIPTKAQKKYIPIKDTKVSTRQASSYTAVKQSIVNNNVIEPRRIHRQTSLEQSDYRTPSNKKSNSSIGFVWVFLFLAFLGGGSYYLIDTQDSPLAPLTMTTTKTQTVSTTSFSEIIKLPEPSLSIGVNDNSSYRVSKPQALEKDIHIAKAEDNTVISETVKQESHIEPNIMPVKEPDDNVQQEITTYRADIEKDSQGITIMLHGPENTAMLKNVETEKIDQIEAQQIQQDNNFSSMAEAEVEPANENTQQQLPYKIINERIHIVIKGDTLWDIAAYYVHDPFRYPELARLSNIKNPDLIYPGNRVRILQVESVE